MYMSTLVFLVFALSVQATIFVTSPASDGTCQGGSSCTVEWEDNGEAPLLSTIGPCFVGLYNGNHVLIQQIDPVNVASVHSLTFTPDPQAGPNGGGYYVNFTTVNPIGSPAAHYTQYSPDFKLDAMDGSFSSPVASDTSSISAPSTILSPTSLSVSASATAASASGSISANASVSAVSASAKSSAARGTLTIPPSSAASGNSLNGTAAASSASVAASSAANASAISSAILSAASSASSLSSALSSASGLVTSRSSDSSVIPTSSSPSPSASPTSSTSAALGSPIQNSMGIIPLLVAVGTIISYGLLF
ncbi:hypothetical protein CERSUDRAFT_114942 [Gelatoporia subvermispora B]|uniref:Yeast cell wall synthesis Kre9/Knh1-like N-terminal domain-containing protein n=1 Tax=Ceriporiopsis subvermispora (strain B) TaxID=914234 RepID=M2RE03_CERS8|nr:hypothetical protein CERSUDRAFT_114942 [Gelatoporia subvermispora B]